MKEKYPVYSERYGHIHNFVRLEDGNYAFVPKEDWMPIYVTMSCDGDCIGFIDTEGGPCIGVGFRTIEIEVEDIISVGNNIEFKLKEL